MNERDTGLGGGRGGWIVVGFLSYSNDVDRWILRDAGNMIVISVIKSDVCFILRYRRRFGIIGGESVFDYSGLRFFLVASLVALALLL